MGARATVGNQPLCFDTMCLAHFAHAERLDVLGSLVAGRDCWTTSVVLAELRRGAASYPLLTAAVDLDWLRVAGLEALDEIACFVKWAGRIGSQDRDLGEASVLAAAELRAGIAVTDDRDATKVARRHGAVVHGTIWLLAEACKANRLSLTGAGNLIDALASGGARLPCSGADFPAFVRKHRLLST